MTLQYLGVNAINEMIDKISATVYFPCRGLILKHNVSLASKDEATKKRKYFHDEYRYFTGKYSDVSEALSLRLNFSSYLTLEILGQSFTDNSNVMFSQKGLSNLKLSLNNVMKWFTSKEYQDMYMLKNNKLIFNSDYNGTYEKIHSVGKTIIIRPVIIEIEEDKYEGVDIYINKNDNKFQMVFEEIVTFYDVIKNFNLYQSGLELINYVGKPEIGKYQQVVDVSYKTNTTKMSMSKGLEHTRTIGEEIKKKVSDEEKEFESIMSSFKTQEKEKIVLRFRI